MNIVVLIGRTTRTPELRELPSGDKLGVFEIFTPEHSQSIPVTVLDPDPAIMGIASNTRVVVTGSVGRRFFRTPAGTGSRTEVSANTIVPLSETTKVENALTIVAAKLQAR